LLLQNGFSLPVGIGFILVVAVLVWGPHLHFVAEMPRLVDIAVTQHHGFAAPPTGVVFAELIGFISRHYVELRIVGKSELNTCSHWVKDKPFFNSFAGKGTFIPIAISRPNSGNPLSKAAGTAGPRRPRQPGYSVSATLFKSGGLLMISKPVFGLFALLGFIASAKSYRYDNDCSQTLKCDNAA
jgi:hypothetical protein